MLSGFTCIMAHCSPCPKWKKQLKELEGSNTILHFNTFATGRLNHL